MESKNFEVYCGTSKEREEILDWAGPAGFQSHRIETMRDFSDHMYLQFYFNWMDIGCSVTERGNPKEVIDFQYALSILKNEAGYDSKKSIQCTCDIQVLMTGGCQCRGL